MRCPLCGGPLHLERPERYACERGHTLEGERLSEAAASRVTMAFWMAIEALEAEAEALTLLPAGRGGNEELAAQAAEDAQVLRDMARAHLAPLGGVGDRS